MSELQEISDEMAAIQAQLEEALRPGAPPPPDVRAQAAIPIGTLIPIIIQVLPSIIDAVARLVEVIREKEEEDGE